ncbi:MAG TPA: hypothetical protein VK832_13840 [Burkholderiaceae bacterium]|jgi:hypothetical protein|nr:hypothetical protein [Burkholderiaceae bacterium]
MSCDFGVWFPYERLTSNEAAQLYTRLCEGESDLAPPHPAVDAFYDELTAMHPEIDSIDDDRIDDHDYCPWSCTLDHSPGHVIMPCVWSKAEYVDGLVHQLARKHGLVVYDPQSDKITYPDTDSASIADKRPWWRLW